MVEEPGFFSRMLQCLRSTRAQLRPLAFLLPACADGLLDGAMDLVERNPQVLKHKCANSLALPHDPQQDVLGADSCVLKDARLVSCELDNPIGSPRQSAGLSALT